MTRAVGTTEFFGRVAREVGTALAFEYPETVDSLVTEYLHAICDLGEARAG